MVISLIAKHAKELAHLAEAEGRSAIGNSFLLLAFLTLFCHLISHVVLCGMSIAK